MKNLFDAMFCGSFLMAPKYAIIIILFGSLAAVGEQSGLDKVTYTSIAVIGVVLGISSVVYSARAEAKESAVRNVKSDSLHASRH